ncbi:hypothetical protein HKX48_004089 [Thoreauomyces humboldtii]|nr:hypothetical protein HKX48_004089 [Thoreauomyces humboldtii]
MTVLMDSAPTPVDAKDDSVSRVKELKHDLTQTVDILDGLAKQLLGKTQKAWLQERDELVAEMQQKRDVFRAAALKQDEEEAEKGEKEESEPRHEKVTKKVAAKKASAPAPAPAKTKAPAVASPSEYPEAPDMSSDEEEEEEEEEEVSSPKLDSPASEEQSAEEDADEREEEEEEEEDEEEY